MRVWEQSNLYFSTALHGRLLLAENSPQIDQGIMFGTQPTGPKQHRAIMRLPKESHERYRCAIHNDEHDTFFNSDAVLLGKPNRSIAFATSDCGATILYAKDTGDVVLAHTGRNQLMSSEQPEEHVSILEASLKMLQGRGAELDSIFSLSVSQIAPIHFAHHGHPDEALVRSQAAIWGASILKDAAEATLDLVELITLQLEFYGIPKSNVTKVRINPYTSPDLASKRAGKTGSNVIMVARLPILIPH